MPVMVLGKGSELFICGKAAFIINCGLVLPDQYIGKVIGVKDVGLRLKTRKYQ